MCHVCKADFLKLGQEKKPDKGHNFITFIIQMMKMSDFIISLWKIISSQHCNSILILPSITIRAWNL